MFLLIILIPNSFSFQISTSNELDIIKLKYERDTQLS